MKNRECRRKFYVLPLFVVLIASFILGACTTPEKAKTQHVARGQALLKDKKFQEAVLEFRTALQIDEKLADAHWGLAKDQATDEHGYTQIRNRLFLTRGNLCLSVAD